LFLKRLLGGGNRGGGESGRGETSGGLGGDGARGGSIGGSGGGDGFFDKRRRSGPFAQG